MSPSVSSPPAIARTLLQELAATHGRGEELPALNIDQIDNCIAEYQMAELAADAADGRLKEAKMALIALVQQRGHVPAGADQSKRIVGRRNLATITIARAVEIKEDAVTALEGYLDSVGLFELFHQLFSTVTKHQLIKGAEDLLKTVQVRKPEHDKILGLFGRCFVPKPKAPSLKVELIEAEKPVRKPRGGKAE